MGVAVALVENACRGLWDHIAATDTLDGPFNRAVGYRHFPDEGLITALTVEYPTVDPQQGVGSGGGSLFRGSLFRCLFRLLMF